MTGHQSTQDRGSDRLVTAVRQVGSAGAEPPLRLLIVAYHFPPSGVVGARRPGALASLAVEQGWDVRVLTGTADADGTPAVGVGDWRIIRPRPARRSSATPATPTASSPGTGAGRWPRRLARTAVSDLAVGRSVRHLAREALLVPDRQVGWIVPAVRRLLAVRDGWRPDVIVASGPPFSGFLVARALAGRLAVPWVADYRDLWTVGNEYWGYGQSRPRRAIDRRLERWLLRSARSCVTISEPLAKTLRLTFGTETHVVMNGIDPRPVGGDTPAPAVPPSPLWSPAPASLLTLAHTGVIYPGKRDPGPLLAALGLLGEDRERVRVVLTGAETRVAREAVEQSGTADVVTVTGQVPVAESWRVQAEADVNVLLMWNDPRDAGTVPGKLFDYLVARRPILMIGHPDGVAAEIIRSRSAGVVLAEPRDIAGQLRSWLAAKDRYGTIPALPDSVLDGLSRRDQLERFLTLLTDIARRGRVGGSGGRVAVGAVRPTGADRPAPDQWRRRRRPAEELS